MSQRNLENRDSESLAQPSGEASTTPDSNKIRFSLVEFSGGLGDLGTFLPLAIAMVLTCGMGIAPILVLAGAANIFAGLRFSLPIPVQPMKAIAAVAITEGLLPGEIAASGLLVGGTIFFISITGLAEKFESVIPKALIRGIQLGVGIKLAIKGLNWVAGSAWLGFDSIALALGGALLVLFFGRIKQFPVALALFGSGLVISYILLPHSSLPAPGWLSIKLILPSGSEFMSGFYKGALPQLPLTLLNSVLAVCALSGDLFGARKVPAAKMSASIGLVNFLSCPLGGLPLCFGSGGLAAQYYFGARSGGSVLMLGSLLIITGLFFGPPAAQLLQFFPQSILGVMLLFAGLELASPAKDQRDRQAFFVMVITATGILALNASVGFGLGLTAHLIGQRLSPKI